MPALLAEVAETNVFARSVFFSSAENLLSVTSAAARVTPTRPLKECEGKERKRRQST